jgi:hypothetical protein
VEGVNLWHMVNPFMAIKRYQFPLLLYGNPWQSSQTVLQHYTGAASPNFIFKDPGLLLGEHHL